MKFGRYLEETQAGYPWIYAKYSVCSDFKGLKKRIAAIRKARPTSASQDPESSRHPTLLGSPYQRTSYGSMDTTGVRQNLPLPEVPEAVVESPMADDEISIGKPDTPLPRRSLSDGVLASSSADRDSGILRMSVPKILGSIVRRRSQKFKSIITIENIYSPLDPLERDFFTYLDHELEKVDKFYNEREDAVLKKLIDLKIQLKQLSSHRRVAHEVQALRQDAWNLPRVIGEVVGVTKNKMHQLDVQLGHKDKPLEDPRINAPSGSRIDITPHNPAEYQHAKKSLKKAMREFYRGLELLNDYRILNLTGFRKALKKYEKITRPYKQTVQDLYMKEKIQPRRFAFSETLNDAMREIENTYAARFENGDRKQARKRLKSPGQLQSHYFSTFCSGLFIGLGLPGLISGIYNSGLYYIYSSRTEIYSFGEYLGFQPHVREQIPQWGPLLEIYATLMIFVVFALLLGVNMLVWTQARINFQFMFELDVRTAVDTRVYFEFPAFLFATLSLCVWLSFSLVGTSHIAPTTWPLIWLVFALVLLFNPFPIFARGGRAWLIKHVIRLLTAGTTSVEFADFWLGDQFCSLTFSLAHIYTIGCAYDVGWKDVFGRCASSAHWVTFALLTLPYFSRLVQSVRRYYDSKLPTHLINAGKYGSSILNYALYYVWRMRGSKYDTSFVVWCIFATLNSVYSYGWDLLMDWSFLSRQKPHPLLRPELIYTNNAIIYYFAIHGVNRRVRAAIAAGLEMLRRFQWNFFRLENEQIGNTDQYRATREVPLPYAARYRSEEEDDDESDEDIEEGAAARASIRARDSVKLKKRDFSLNSQKQPASSGTPSPAVNGDVDI
ncbi:hypothetical protein M422DRAFT_50759 [Sphaerobolus stellatus SS14]|uniref:SPX domain-containing protein n=1 Tax=Sphaerobolus stellatus (strain SS14) TaxID=990650 RepID=A0A0C9VI56_SPHS4|nr:hypothetical protein M422DRAFT_50759 [Sphaerobolus stellatus SS14]